MKFPELNLSHSFVYIGMLSSSANLFHVFCLFVCFCIGMYLISNLFFEHFPKSDKRVAGPVLASAGPNARLRRGALSAAVL